jgi:hypothetical protein
MIFFWAETPDGLGIPGIHGPFAVALFEHQRVADVIVMEMAEENVQERIRLRVFRC